MTDKIRTLQGRVISDKMDKSITVAIERKVKHRSTVRSSSVLPSCTCMTKQRVQGWRPRGNPRVPPAVQDQVLDPGCCRRKA